jgi:tetratricopeptide (TPR) repeat protein
MTEAAAPSSSSRRSPFLRPVPIALAVVLGLGLAIVAYRRGGVLDLPPVPSGVTIEAAGLDNLGALRERARALETMTSRADVRGAVLEGDVHLAKAAEGLAAVRRGEGEPGLQKIREALSEQPDDMVIGNAYRMSVMSLRRSALAKGANRETLAERLPAYLQGEPVATLDQLYRKHPSRDTGFQLALGWVDDILLTPKPEARVVAGLASMRLLNEILAKDPYYVPALCARGAGYLNPPARIDFIPAWRETLRPVPNAASRDLALCVAIGRYVGAGSAHTAAEQAINLGDAYAKEGQPERARSWWQLAQNASRDADLLEAVRRRYNWRDSELVEQLEAEREVRAADLDHPLTDLSPTWQ